MSASGMYPTKRPLLPSLVGLMYRFLSEIYRWSLSRVGARRPRRQGFRLCTLVHAEGCGPNTWDDCIEFTVGLEACVGLLIFYVIAAADVPCPLVIDILKFAQDFEVCRKVFFAQ